MRFFYILFLLLVVNQFAFSQSAKGLRLAKKHCATCHLLPSPKDLDKTTWTNSVLPNMGQRLGIKDSTLILDGNFPEVPLLNESEWALLVGYYSDNSPDKLEGNGIPSLKQQNLFNETTISLGNPVPQTSMISFADNEVLIGDLSNKIIALDSVFNLKNVWFTESAPVKANFTEKDAPLVLTIGEFNPSDNKNGSLAFLKTDTDQDVKRIDSLRRPVFFKDIDLDNDGINDALVCEFGNNVGELSWYKSFDQNKKNILSNSPGSRTIEITDFNKDGMLDLVVLFAQANERVSAFINKGNGIFEEEVLLEFPAVYGSSFFQLVDFDRDGKLDILYSNGDNWDISSIKKPYHGIRIFMNKGKSKFVESWFYAINGASKTLAVDFDLDGDLDIVATSFYDDIETPEHSFIYFENKGNQVFEPRFSPVAAQGKWLLMETVDFDKDGDVDVFLGSYFQNVQEMTKLISRGVMEFPQAIYLENTTN